MTKVLRSFCSIFLCGALMASSTSSNGDDKLVQTKRSGAFYKVVDAVENKIEVLAPHLGAKAKRRIAALVSAESLRTGISAAIMLAILKTESDFNQTAVSSTNDLSIAQINPRVWGKGDRFFKITKKHLNVARLKRDDAYAIYCMSEILRFLKAKHSKNDKWWFARYHSANPVYKEPYKRKLKFHLQKIMARDEEKTKAKKAKNLLSMAARSQTEYEY